MEPTAPSHSESKRRSWFASTMEFAASRLFLKEFALLRVMRLLVPHRRAIFVSNVCVGISQFFGATALVALVPLFSYALTLGGEPVGADARAAVKLERAEKSDAADSASATSNIFLKRIERMSPWVRNTVDGMHKRYDSVMVWAKASPKRFISLYCAFLIVLILLQGVFQFVGQYAIDQASTEVMSEMLRSVYANVLRQEMRFFDKTLLGTILNTCYREVFQLRPMITFLASTRIMLPVNMVILFAALLFISWELSVLLILLMPVLILPTLSLTRRIKAGLYQEMDDEVGAMDAMAEGVQGILAVKTFGAEKDEERRMEPAIQNYLATTRRRRAGEAVIGPSVDFLHILIILTVFVVATLVFPQSMRFGKADLIAFLFAMQRFYRPMRSMLTMNLRLQRSDAVARRIFDDLDRVPEIVDKPGAVEFPREWQQLAFEHVDLAYTIKRKGQKRKVRALLDASFTIHRGESVALIGPNGAGKSSIVNLICRLYEPTGGQVRFDSTPIEEIRMGSLHGEVCLITQTPILFNRTVEENIAFGMEGATPEAIREAARLTNAHGFIEKLPQGYQTDVGEQGRLLSGGERQKIALARAFIRRPSLLILDEPTAGLDRESVREFLRLVARIHEQGVTILYITHEWSQLDRFDRVLRVNKNVVEESRDALAGVGAET